ncbi:MAG: AAA family ATPase [Alphaproteobacteria bacterium]
MYEQFYGLTEKPFSILPDPGYLFWSKTHSMAFAMIEYGIMNRAGFTVVTGEIGCGKTTLVRHLLEELDETTTVGLVSNASENRGELLQWVLMSFGQPYDDGSYVALHSRFTDFLIAEYAAGRRTVLIVDEAQNLAPSTLEELRMLSNINADKHQLLQMILLGQPELRDLLNRPDLVQFAQRVSADFHLKPLSESEVEDYIQHRTKLAGREAPIFNKQACLRVAQATKGIPRLVNIICDTALVYGFSSGKEVVDEAIIEDVISDKAEYGVFTFAGKDDQAPAPKLDLSPKTPLKIYSIE